MLSKLVNSLRWILVLFGAALLALAFLNTRGLPAALLALFGLLLLLGGVGMFYWYIRPNRAEVSKGLKLETWEVVNDGLHNSNTDLLYWEGNFYLVYAAAPYHFGSQSCRLKLLRSPDAHQWEKLAEFSGSAGAEKDAPQDIRDPKLALIGNRLFLYALQNSAFNPEPYTTVYSFSEDQGRTWSPLRRIEPEGWLFWRPKSADGRVWYAPAYWWEHGKSALFRSIDGVNWEMIGQIYAGDRNDETDIEFLADNKMIATARLEINDSVLGHPDGSTLIAVAEAPYATWTVTARSRLTRLDGPALFSLAGEVFACGRRQPGIRGPFCWQGSIFARKRTALFLVRETGLQLLTDLPSAGDTSYAGAALVDGWLYICYYTSDVKRDFPWIVGMFNPTPIMMARVKMENLLQLAGL